jgi:hypothetical protein
MLSAPTRGRGRRRAVVVVLADLDAEVTALHTTPSRPRGPRTPRVLAVVAATDDQIHRRLAALDRLDLVVDVRGSGDERQLRTFRRCFFHLNGDGTWVALRSSELAAGTEPMVALATRLSTRLTTGTAGDEWQAHARGSRRISVTPEAVLIGARPRHVLLLRDAELPLLSEREPALRVTTLASLPGGSVPGGPLLHVLGRRPRAARTGRPPLPAAHTPALRRSARTAAVDPGSPPTNRAPGLLPVAPQGRARGGRDPHHRRALRSTPEGGAGTTPRRLPLLLLLLQQQRALRPPDDRGRVTTLGVVARQGRGSLAAHLVSPSPDAR